MFVDFFKFVKFPPFLVPLQNFFALFVSSRLFSFQIFINAYINISLSYLVKKLSGQDSDESLDLSRLWTSNSLYMHEV